MGKANDETREKAGRVVFGALAAAIVATLLWNGHREGRLAFAAGAVAASLVPGALGIAVATRVARRRGRVVTQLDLALGAFVPSAIAFALALWASGEAPLDVVAKSLMGGLMIFLVFFGVWVGVRGFPDPGGGGEPSKRRHPGEP